MTYHITMSDGLKQDIKAMSAADAQQKALEMHRGQRVVACHSGGTTGKYAVGRIDYEIPRHDPVPLEAPAPRRSKLGLPDHTTPMFHDDTIKMESSLAKENYRHHHEQELQALSPKTVDSQPAAADHKS